jgi:hypothetical protein
MIKTWGKSEELYLCRLDNLYGAGYNIGRYNVGKSLGRYSLRPVIRGYSPEELRIYLLGVLDGMGDRDVEFSDEEARWVFIEKILENYKDSPAHRKACGI